MTSHLRVAYSAAPHLHVVSTGASVTQPASRASSVDVELRVVARPAFSTDAKSSPAVSEARWLAWPRAFWQTIRLPRIADFAQTLPPRLRRDLALDEMGRTDGEVDRARHVFTLSGFPPPRL